MKKFLCFIALFTPFLLQAQIVLQGANASALAEGAQTVRVGKTGVPVFIIRRHDSPLAYRDALPWLYKILHAEKEDTFKLLHITTENNGQRHHRYQQYHQGIAVDNAVYLLHEKQGVLISCNGIFFNQITVNTTPVLSPEKAIENAIHHIGATEYKWERKEETAHMQKVLHDPEFTFYPRPQLVIVPPASEEHNYRLAYKTDIYAHRPLSRKLVYVDALTGEVFAELDRIHTTDASGTASTFYSGLQPVTANYAAPSTYLLTESSRGQGIETYNMQQGTDYGLAVDFTDDDNYWNNVNSQQDEVATDAHWGAEMTYDYYYQTYGRNSIDGAGLKLLNYVHFDSGLDNASWDGYRMSYGDGSSGRPYTGLDVIGHEITHGLTEYTSNLQYQDEPGALNESFSDIFGTAVEFFAKSSTANYTVGEDVTGDAFGLRSMSNPSLYGLPDTYQGTYWYTGTGDNGGVHINSSVQNFWFYLLSSGGSGTNDLGNAYSVAGVGIDKAAAIAYRTLTVYLVSLSDYSDARFYSIQAATDLYGACSNEVMQTVRAWHAVGIGSTFLEPEFSSTVTTYCNAPVTTTFSNLSFGGTSFLWHFGDGTTSSLENPCHSYSSFGDYTVKLVVSGCSQIDSIEKINYVSVHPNNPCLLTMPPSGTSSCPQTACTGTLYDMGGINDYNNLSNSAITIAPTGASSVRLSFSLFSYEDGFDSLYVYDGPNTTSPLIGGYTGSSLPNGGILVTSGGAVTLRHFSDTYVVGNGFLLDWSCMQPGTPPDAAFQTNDTFSCSGIISFYNLSGNNPDSVRWNFGDNSTSSLSNPVHTYANSGTYDIRLIAYNSYGSDTMTKNVFIRIARPDGPAATSANGCAPASLQLSASGNGVLRWYDAAVEGNLAGTGTLFTTPLLNNTTVYFVESEIQKPSEYAGPADTAFGTGGMFNSNDLRGLYFNVYKPLTIKTLSVYANDAASRTIEVRDSYGNVVYTKAFSLLTGLNTLPVNIALQPATAYFIKITGYVNLYRQNAGTVFPYSVPGLISITGTNAGSPGYYYYFYHWEITEPVTCISERTPDTAYIYLPAKPVIVQNGQALDCSPATSYQWYFEGNILPGETNSSITVTQSGNYTVIVTDGNQCTAISDPYYFTNTYVDVAHTIELRLYPNPVRDILHIEYGHTTTKIYATLYAVSGKKLRSLTLYPSPGEKNIASMPLDDYPSGIYFLKIQKDDGESSIFKIAK